MGITTDPQPIATYTGRAGERPPRRNFHPHLWPAVDLPLTDWPHADALRSATEQCDLKQTISVFSVTRMPGPQGALLFSLEAEAGHTIPSGATQDRRMWIEATGFDASDKEIFALNVIAEGELEESEEQARPCLFRQYMLDDNGEETHDFWEAERLDEQRGMLLPFRAKRSAPITSHSKECVLYPPLSAADVPAERLEVRVRMRPMGMDVLNDLVSTGHLAPEVPARMQTLTMMAWTLKYNADTDAYEQVFVTDYNCNEWQCLMDPASKACAE